MVDWALLAGPIAGIVFWVASTWLGLTRRGYSMVRQTVSELGALGDKAKPALAALNLTIALCSLIFAYGLLCFSRQSGIPGAPAYFVGFFALPAVGLAAFPTPHPLHNVFGLLQTVAFIGAPLSVALGWRGPGVLTPISWAALALLIVAMVLNLAPAFSPRLAKAFAPVYGVLQRSIFLAWYGWCAILGLLLFLRA